MELLRARRKACVFFLNLDSLFKARHNKKFQEALRQATLVLPDGVGLRLAARVQGFRIRHNCNGTDFSPLLIEHAHRAGYSFFLLGSKPGIAEKAAANLKSRWPDIKIQGTHPGYFQEDEPVIDKINACSPDILLVAMGSPLQEQWIQKNRKRLKPTLCLGVGALLDFLSGRVPRAPRWMIRLNIEWLWRFLQEPSRLAGRYFAEGPGLLFYLIVSRMKSFVRRNGGQ